MRALTDKKIKEKSASGYRCHAIGSPCAFDHVRPPRHDECIHPMCHRHNLQPKEPWLIVNTSLACILSDRICKTNHDNSPWRSFHSDVQREDSGRYGIHPHHVFLTRKNPKLLSDGYRYQSATDVWPVSENVCNTSSYEIQRLYCAILANEPGKAGKTHTVDSL
jgi:hypothetical protein